MAISTKKFDHSIIKCSAGKGVMPLEDCLKCALDGDNICGYSFALLRTIFRENVRTGIHVSDLLNCPRMAYYNRAIVSPESPHERLAITLGTAVHHYVEEPEQSFFISEMPVEAYGVVGTADMYYTKEKRVMDLKTTRWLKPSKLPYGHHAQQVNVYAHMLKKMGYEVESLAIQYVDMSGPTKCRKCYVPVHMTSTGLIECPKCGQTPKDAHLGAMVFEVPMLDDEEIEAFMIERRDVLIKAFEDEQEPEREVGFLCNYCNHFETCKPYSKDNESEEEW